MELVDKGVLTIDEAMNSPRRNVITRAVGAHPDIEVDAVYGRIEPEDCFVLCSDGLTAHCTDEDILRGVLGRSARDVGRHLVGLALQRGATDNVTVVVVRVLESGSGFRSDAGPPGRDRWAR
jgi:protein phosphatase